MPAVNLSILIASDPKYRSLLPLADEIFREIYTAGSRQLVDGFAEEHSLPISQSRVEKFMEEMERLGLTHPADWMKCYEQIIQDLQIFRVRRGH